MQEEIYENQDSLKEFFLEFLRHYSPSGDEKSVSLWLVEKMKEFGFDRAFNDEVHNAIGEIGDPEAPNNIICLGHIDTVNGELPVKFENDIPIGGTIPGVFWGRGAVDAKGPFTNFLLGALKFKETLSAYNLKARPEDRYKLIIIGAVEEELYTSKGAHHVQRNGFLKKENLRAVIIGEPSGYEKITLGYKGRWNFEIGVETPRTHTAHNNMGAAEILVGIYDKIKGFCDEFNKGKSVFGTNQLHVRSIFANSDNAQEEDSDSGVMKLSLRGSENFSDVRFFENLVGGYINEVREKAIGRAIEPMVIEKELRITLRTEAFDAVAVSAKTTPLVKAFLRAMRGIGIEPRFSYKTGTSDMNVLGVYFPQVPIVTYGPGDSRLDHTKEEHLLLSDLIKSSEVLNAVFEELLPM